MGRWRDSWAARNPSVRLAWPMPQTRLPLWFRATGSSALMEVLPDMAAASVGSAGCSFTRGSLWRSLPRDVFQKRHESLKIGWIRPWLTGARSCKALPLASPISPPIEMRAQLIKQVGHRRHHCDGIDISTGELGPVFVKGAGLYDLKRQA